MNDIAGNLAAIRRTDRRGGCRGRARPRGPSGSSPSRRPSAPTTSAPPTRPGQRDFGENKVQEALQKIDETAELEIRWHLIGHLQSNKVKKAAPAFAAIHAIDSVDLVRRVDAAAVERRGGAGPVYPGRPRRRGDQVRRPGSGRPGICAGGLECRAARLKGLMLLPPWFDDPEQARPVLPRACASCGAARRGRHRRARTSASCRWA